MNFGFTLPRFSTPSKEDLGGIKTENVLMEQSRPKARFDIKIWGWSLLSVVPWAVNARGRSQGPTTINKELKRRARSGSGVDHGRGVDQLRFRPYVSKVPWHKGARAFLSQLFPRYGHYCGPNWSSGKDGGSHVWDMRPIDWLDYCCYCHDIGYDTHDQAELLKADLAFLECLERPDMATRGDAQVAHLYKTMCTSGLRSILIPYRQNLLKLQSGQPLIDFGWLLKWRWINFQKS